MKINGLQSPNIFNRMNITSHENDYMMRNSLSFTNDNESGENEGKKKFSVKKATNIAGVLAWLGLVAYGARVTKVLQKNSPEMVSNDIKSIRAQIKAGIENASYAKNGVDDKAKLNGIQKAFYGIGDWVQRVNNKISGELFNNLIYAFGTLVVMPLIVMLSPQKKENSSKGDKFFTIARQPLSVLATLTMQYTFDKVLKNKIPDVLKSNRLEDKTYLNSEGKFLSKDKNGNNVINQNAKLADLLDKVKYNQNEAESILKELTEIEPKDGGLKGIFSREELENVLNDKNFKSYEKKDAKTLTKKLYAIYREKFNIGETELKTEFKSKLGLPKDKDVFELLTSDDLEKSITEKIGDEGKKVASLFKKYLNVYNRNELLSQKVRVGVNVAIAAPIACTFLNVIYGKTMKAIKNDMDNKNQVKEAK